MDACALCNQNNPKTSTMLSELLQFYRCSVQAVRPDNLIKTAIKLENGRLCINPKSPCDRTIHVKLQNRDVFLFGAGKLPKTT